MKPVTIHDEAAHEIRQASHYYERQRAGLGREFRVELERAHHQIQTMPYVPPPLDERGTRKLRLNRFPYTIYYVELPAFLWIAAVGHQKRKPGFWANRGPDD